MLLVLVCITLTWSSGRENSFQKFLMETNEEAAIFVFNNRQLGVMRSRKFVDVQKRFWLALVFDQSKPVFKQFSIFAGRRNMAAMADCFPKHPDPISRHRSQYKCSTPPWKEQYRKVIHSLRWLLVFRLKVEMFVGVNSGALPVRTLTWRVRRTAIGGPLERLPRELVGCFSSEAVKTALSIATIQDICSVSVPI